MLTKIALLIVSLLGIACVAMAAYGIGQVPNVSRFRQHDGRPYPWERPRPED